VAGYIPCFDPYYEKTSIVVVPLLNGAGTRIKILEAMAFQRPVVSTSIGAEGLEVTDGKDILIADEPTEFAQKCIELLKSPDKRRRVISNAYRLVKEKYDLPVFYQAMDKIFETIMNGGFKNA
jgi:polysaccharide biosynthesis protein PslH